MLQLLTKFADIYSYSSSSSDPTFTTTTTTTTTTASPNVAAIIIILIGLVGVTALLVLAIVGMWKMFKKAGKPGWASIVPFLNTYMLLEIAGRPGWWLLLFFIPIVNIFIAFIVAIDVAKSFGKSSAFGFFALGIFSTIGYLILGFGKATYHGPAALEGFRPSAGVPPTTPTTPTTPEV